ncbi:hypothetical protein Goe21_02930 [Bacillus phage vB_BsuM-Goe21]|nr:hypothetical protein Goe21_02930 [Bacillus phage vB_BsuM-Goe21]
MFNAKEGEIILDKKTGHVTIKHNGKYKSKTKELEARANALLSYKNKLVKKFIELAEEIERLLNSIDVLKDDTKKVRDRAEELYVSLTELDADVESLMTLIDNFCKELKDFQYKEIRPFLDPIVDNLKDILKLKATIDEMKFLANDITNQKISNKSGLDQIGGGY